ncbi:MAG: hypothetical protein ABIP75_14310 [Pyrinomonadaceae bacterium]
MELFDRLADEIEHAWRATWYDELAFPRIASEALAKANLHERVTPWQILESLGTSPGLTEQRDLPGGFSNLPLTLANRPRFFIDLYLWLDGTTTIHQHSFAGAFQVLEGSSLHSRYRFDESRRINDHFRLGEVVFESSELLRQGAVSEIIPGSSFAHSLFHLARPSATITVRTFQLATQTPQFDYLKPSIAIDHFFSDQLTTKRVRTVALMLATPHQDAELVIRECLRTADAHTAFLLLAEVNKWTRQPSLRQMFEPGAIDQRAADLVEFARTLHGELIDKYVEVFSAENRAVEIIKRRGQVSQDAQRYFLALLLNLPDRDQIIKLMWAYSPQVDPMEHILELIDGLGNTRVLQSAEPNVLGLPEWNEGYLFLVELMLAGKSMPEIFAAVKEEWPYPGEVADEWVIEACRELRESILQNLLHE